MHPFGESTDWLPGAFDGLGNETVTIGDIISERPKVVALGFCTNQKCSGWRQPGQVWYRVRGQVGYCMHSAPYHSHADECTWCGHAIFWSRKYRPAPEGAMVYERISSHNPPPAKRRTPKTPLPKRHPNKVDRRRRKP